MTPPAAGRARRRAKAGPTPIADEVYDELLSRVLSARLGPGARVTIDALGRELEVSQTPIREALHRLEQNGLVRHRVRRSTTPLAAPTLDRSSSPRPSRPPCPPGA